MSIIVEKHGSIIVISLNRPEKLNALSHGTLDELSSAFDQIKLQSDLRAVILTGVGERAFCVGTDIAQLNGQDEESARGTSSRGQEVCDQIERCEVPVIAAINGLVAGGGFELALACHLRIASTGARFNLLETTIGMIPEFGGTQRLLRIVGIGRAKEGMLTGETITADEALRIGLVNRVTAPERLLVESKALAFEIAELAPLAIRACLTAVTRGLTLPLDEGLELEAELFGRLFATRDVHEGTRAFLEKRAPVFTGE